MLPYDSTCDFGPHLMTEIQSHQEPNMEKLFDFFRTAWYLRLIWIL